MRKNTELELKCENCKSRKNGKKNCKKIAKRKKYERSKKRNFLKIFRNIQVHSPKTKFPPPSLGIPNSHTP